MLLLAKFNYETVTKFFLGKYFFPHYLAIENVKLASRDSTRTSYTGQASGETVQSSRRNITLWAERYMLGPAQREPMFSVFKSLEFMQNI